MDDIPFDSVKFIKEDTNSNKLFISEYQDSMSSYQFFIIKKDLSTCNGQLDLQYIYAVYDDFTIVTMTNDVYKINLDCNIATDKISFERSLLNLTYVYLRSLSRGVFYKNDDSVCFMEINKFTCVSSILLFSDSVDYDYNNYSFSGDIEIVFSNKDGRFYIPLYTPYDNDYNRIPDSGDISFSGRKEIKPFFLIFIILYLISNVESFTCTSDESLYLGSEKLNTGEKVLVEYNSGEKIIGFHVDKDSLYTITKNHIRKHNKEGDLIIKLENKLPFPLFVPDYQYIDNKWMNMASTDDFIILNGIQTICLLNKNNMEIYDCMVTKEIIRYIKSTEDHINIYFRNGMNIYDIHNKIYSSQIVDREYFKWFNDTVLLTNEAIIINNNQRMVENEFDINSYGFIPFKNNLLRLTKDFLLLYDSQYEPIYNISITNEPWLETYTIYEDSILLYFDKLTYIKCN